MRLPETIATERLTLRPLRPSDAGPMMHYAGDKRVAEMLETVPHPYPPGVAEAYIERVSAGQVQEIVRVMDASAAGGPEFIGVLSLKAEEEPGAFRLGYWVGPPFWNTGYASEAAAELVKAARDAGAKRLTARVIDGNEASAHVLAHIGFEESGAGECYSVAQGAMRPCRTFTLSLKKDAQ